MSNETIENSAEASEAEQPKPKRRPGKKAKPTKKAKPAKKAAKPKAGRANKKAGVIALMKRAKGATLAEIAKATGWQAHTVRAFVCTPSKRDNVGIRSIRNTKSERVYMIPG